MNNKDRASVEKIFSLWNIDNAKLHSRIRSLEDQLGIKEEKKHYVESWSDSPVSTCGKFVALCVDDWLLVTCEECLHLHRISHLRNNL